jgi:predicted transcriptional regulator
VLVAPRASLRSRVWRHRHLLALGAVLLLVSATIGYRLYRTRLEGLPQVAEASRTEGLEALAGGAFDVAKSKLSVAAEALEELRDPGAAEVRQAASEAAIFADLANRSLEELLEEVATASQAEAERVVLTQKGRSILVDSRIAATAGAGQAPDLEYRVFAGTRQGRLDLEGFELFRGRAFKAGDPVTFGARIGSVHLGPDNTWHIGLEPASGVFVSSPQAWRATEALGWPARDAPAEDQP